ncbi:hypothetical protein PSHT_09801 [Puccinia striiformis]|uniref:Uncharacterized protein n=1 Tax=Puccinia striiformis TaxID=27350 RepID=A0A2S4VEB5_9BASI|nr:hypothetical protein PSHT_09801 [Puccinia striiformis]
MSDVPVKTLEDAKCGEIPVTPVALLYRSIGVATEDPGKGSSTSIADFSPGFSAGAEEVLGCKSATGFTSILPLFVSSEVFTGTLDIFPFRCEVLLDPGGVLVAQGEKTWWILS